MTMTALHLSYDMLSAAYLKRLGFNLAQNDFSRNITDYCSQTDTGNDALFIRATGPEVPPDRDACLGCAIYATPGAAANVAFHMYLQGSSFAAAEILHVGFRGKAAAAKTVTVRVQDSNNTSKGNFTASFTADWQTFYAPITLSAAAINLRLSFELGADADDAYISDVVVYREIASEELPRFQSASVEQTKETDVAESYNGDAEQSRTIAKGSTRVTIVDPVPDSDVEFWPRKLEDKGVEWSPGVQYLDGDMEETATEFWTTSSCTEAWTTTNAVQGSYALRVAGETTTSAAPYAYISLTSALAGYPMVVSGYVRAGSATTMSCPISVYDGATDQRAATVYTLPTAHPVYVQHAFVPGSATTAVQVRLRSEHSSTDAWNWDAVKLEKGTVATPFSPQPAGYLWALYLKFSDTTYNYHVLVPRLRFEKNSLPVSMGHLMHSISAVGGALLISRVAA